MLEEQAYPFEEKAIELHEINARRAPHRSLRRMGQEKLPGSSSCRPVRYAKVGKR